MSERKRNVIESHFLPYQGGRGDTFNEEIKGEQGIPGFPGVRVGDLNQTAPCCLTNTYVHTYNIHTIVSIFRVLQDFLEEMDCQDMRYTCDMSLPSPMLLDCF